MDPALIQIILGTLLGTGGLGGTIAAIRGIKARKADTVPAVESEARAQVADSDVTKYFQSELKQLRADRAAELKQLRADRAAETTKFEAQIVRLKDDVIMLRNHVVVQATEDAEHIDALEQHIWLRLGPPPPQRKGPRALPPQISS